MNCTRLSSVLAVGMGLCASGVLHGCGGSAGSEEGSEGEAVETRSRALYTDTGVTLWNDNNLGAGAAIPVCFAVRPILTPEGEVRCPNQASGTDCDGNTSLNGHAFSSSELRRLIRNYNEDSWMRYGNVEFFDWGDCPIDPGSDRHIESDLTGWIMVQFLQSDYADFLGKSSDHAAHITYNWDAILNAPNHDKGNVVHEFGHVLGFEHEWLRPDWTNWKCTSGAVASGIFGECLEAAGPKDQDGPVRIAACDNRSEAQSWRQGWDGTRLDGTLQAYGRCLDVAGNGTASGTPVQLFSCNGGANQQWVLASDGTIVNPQSGKCLDVPAGEVGSQLQLFDCHGASNQQFTVPGNPIRSGINGDKCLDVSNADPANGTPIQIFDCHGGYNQSFTQGFDGTRLDGTLRVLGKCLDVIGNDTANGARVQLFDCHGGGNQQWLPQADGSILNPQSGRCLDSTGGSADNGTPLQLFDCNGSAAQRWNVANNIPGTGFGTPPDVGSIMQYCAAGGFVDDDLGPWDILGLQQAYGRKYHGSLVGYRGQCADIQEASTTPGAPVIAYPCRGQWNDTWLRSSSVTSEPFRTPENALCLNLGGSNQLTSASCDNSQNQRFTTVGVEWRAMGNQCVEAVGSGLQLQPCNGSGAQKWDFFHPVGGLRNDQIRRNGTNQCVAASTSRGSLGEALVLTTCSSASTRQRFSTPGAGLLTLSNNTGLCANVAGGTTAAGSAIILWDGCSSNPPMNSQFSLSGKLKVRSRCMASQGEGEVFSAVAADTCDDGNTTTQIWDYYF